MGLFKSFKPPKPAGFTYRPRFYNEPKNELAKKLQEAKEMRGSDPDKMKERIKRDMRKRGSQMSERSYRQKQFLRSNMMLLIIIAALVVVTYAVLELYLPAIVKFFE